MKQLIGFVIIAVIFGPAVVGMIREKKEEKDRQIYEGYLEARYGEKHEETTI